MNQETDDLSAEAWLSLARQGDAAALGSLLNRFRPLLKTRVDDSIGPELGGRLDDSDLVQQTCLSVIREFPNLRGQTLPEFVAWMLEIHRHNVLNAVRYHRETAARAVSREVVLEPNAQELQDRNSSPSQQVARLEQRSLLESCISRLPVEQQEVVRLKFINDLSLSEVSQRIGKSEDAVSGLLRRGVSTLRLLLRDNSEELDPQS